MSLFIRFIIIVTVVVSATDGIIFYHIKKNPEILTVPFIILVVVITIIPIAINLWYWLVFRKDRNNKIKG
ncbi:MAG: hypothetical protein MUP02_01160 [Actinobacteria bacterium]|nr:hypothetical protein [Actinomycetota bacterium]